MWFMSFDEVGFRSKMDKGLSKARTILENHKHPMYPADVEHVYNDKFLLAEVVVGLGICSNVVLLELLGVNPKTLKTLKEWAERQSVTLRLKAEEKCTFDRETKREVESSTKHVRDYGVGSITDKVITTITEYFWNFEWYYELYAFAGTDEEGKVVLQSRRGKLEIMTTVKESPRPEMKIRDAIDMNVTWLLQRCMEGKIQFKINRESKGCKTPRRNGEVEEAFEYFERMEGWCRRVHDYIRNEIFGLEAKHEKVERLSLGSINCESVFIPVLPLFQKDAKKEGDEDGHEAQTLVPMIMSRENGPTLSLGDLNRFVDEEKRSIQEKLTELAVVIPDKGKLISIAEANILVCLLVGERTTHYVMAGVEYIEDMIRKQLVASIGKEVTTVDFANYMVYHNRKVFKPAYQPQAFCYAIRRPDYYPEGILSLERELHDGSMREPIQTIVSRRELEAPMHFSLGGGEEVAFKGEVYLHGLVMHEFEGDKGMRVSLNARARQFSSFLVLVGRISGAGLFDPQFGMIVQNKDDIQIPLDLETIPSAGEFKAATVSISPEMQEFAKMYRGMQLASTLFGVCVIQIKPQMEKLLRLENESLTKEIKMTQELLQLFIEYQIPSDLLSYNGAEETKGDMRVAAVKANMRKIQWTVEWEKLKQEEENLQKEELQSITIRDLPDASMSLRVGGSTVVAQSRRGGKPGKKSTQKIAQALQEIQEIAASTDGLLAQSIAPDLDMDRREKAPMDLGIIAGDVLSEDQPVMAGKKSKRGKASESRSRRRRSSIGEEKERDREDPRKAMLRNRRVALEQKKGRLLEERNEIEKEHERISSLSGNTSSASVVVWEKNNAAVDFTGIPNVLDDRLEKLDTDNALRPTIIHVGKNWTKRSQAGLLGSERVEGMDIDKQKIEKNTCFDLLDALTKSGGLPIEGATLHIVVASSHCFEKNLMDTLVKDNVNPMEKLERSELIVAEVIHGKKAVEMLKKREVQRVQENEPALFEAK